MLDYQLHTFPNGIRIVHKQVTTTKIAHSAIMLDIGSRDEKPGQEGLAHFWEHMVFKGTHKRRAFHILNRLDSVGGELNAYTTKEKICFHATTLDEHFEKSIELLADITFNSIFPEKELEKERGVILEEMAMYYDSPDDALQDDFDNVVFTNHSLGNNIIGTEETVKSFSRSDFQGFLLENMDTEKIIFSSVSNLSFKKVVKIAEKYLKELPFKKSYRIRSGFETYEPKVITKTRNFSQAYCALGRPSYSLNESSRIPFFLLNNILGGPAMNSKLNLELREKYGFVYSVESSYAPFTDTGLFAIYFATEEKQLTKCKSAILSELKKMREKPFSEKQLQTYKEQLMGQLAIADERNSGTMLMMAKSLLDLNRIDSLEEIFNRTKAISSTALQLIAQEMFEENQLSYLEFYPENKKSLP